LARGGVLASKEAGMPVYCEFRDEVLTVTAVGDYLTTELTVALEAALADPRIGRGLPLLLDARSSLASLSRAEVARRAYWLAKLCGVRVPRVAFLSPEGAHRSQIQEHAAHVLSARGVPAVVFSDRASALRWLREAK
jgi:hypothetical protein